MSKLSEYYNLLCKKPMPKQDYDNPEFREIFSDLVLLDSEYAGLADSILSGIDLDKFDISDLDGLYNDLHLIECHTANDKKFLQECIEHVNLLKTLADEILKRIKEKTGEIRGVKKKKGRKD